MSQPLTVYVHPAETHGSTATDGASIRPGEAEETHRQADLSNSGNALEPDGEPEYPADGMAARTTLTYTVPIDPMEALLCDACQ